MIQSVRHSNVLHTGYLLGILLSSWGVIACSVRTTLPHVKKYQTVTPQRLKDSSLTSDAATHQVHCYYNGHIVGVEDSSASVGLCSGMEGFVLLQDQMYLIGRLADPDAGKQDDRHSSETDSNEGLRVVYNYKHLKWKKSSCPHGNPTTYDDLRACPSGLFQQGSLKVEAQTKAVAVKPRTVELVLVADHTLYKKYKKTIETRMLEIANHVDKMYRPMGVRVMLVGVDIWSDKDQIEVSTAPQVTLNRFLEWRYKSLLPRIPHDNAQFITGVDLDDPFVGMGRVSSMCNYGSGGVNQDFRTDTFNVASIIAHEMGHNLGLDHDTGKCVCDSSIFKRPCIMSGTMGRMYPKQFSSCSQQQLSLILEKVNPACLLNTPSTNRIHGGPVCGNAFLEPGEECDCGTVQECKNTCCIATTCKLAQCTKGDCCHNCRLKPTGSVCRPKAGDCDLAEYCTGFSASCPTDAYTQNGLSCNHGKGYCYIGQCPSQQDYCKRLWGPDAEVAAKACFYLHGNCKKTLFSQRCSSRDQSCGTLFCFGGWEFPVTSLKSSFKVGSGEICKEVLINPADNLPADLGIVPTGTKCGNNLVCYNQRCQNITSVKAFGTSNCSAKCNNHGVCNHENKCHCDPGWVPPFCDVLLQVLSEETGMLVLFVCLGVGALLLVVLVIGIVMYCIRKRQSAKR